MNRLFSILLVALLISCELTVDVDVPFEAKQVTANAFFTPDSVWSVQLNLNRSVLDEEPFHEVNDAVVVILEGNNPVDTLINTGPGHFRSDNERPEPGKRYTLSVTSPYGDVQASSSVPFPSAITSAEVYESSAAGNSVLKVKLSDNKAEANYYELHIELENEYFNYYTRELESDRHKVYLTSKDPAIQNDNESVSSSVLFKDLLFNGREVELTFDLSGGGISHHGMITVTLKSLTEEGYTYLRTRRLQDMTSGDPFAQPVNVYNNIQNGFGIFAGYSASVYRKSEPKPVISSIQPLSGRAGDQITITGENFVTSVDPRPGVAFQGADRPVYGEITHLTPTLIEVTVPEGAMTGKILVANRRIAVSESEFVVIK